MSAPDGGGPAVDQAQAGACARVWEAYARLAPLDQADVALVAGLRGPQVQAWFRGRPPAQRVEVPVDGGAGCVPEGFAGHVRSFLTVGTPEWADHLDRCTFASDAARARVSWFERYVGYLDRAVRDGGIRFPEPGTGREADAVDSLQIFDRTVWSFFGDTLFCLLAGGGGSRPVGVYVPAEHRLYDFGADLGSTVSAEGMANVLGLLLHRLARTAEDYHRALAARNTAPATRRVVLAVGKAQNFAHHVWNYYPGIERLVLAGLAGRVTEVRVAGTEFFGPVTGLFPELAGADLVREPRTTVRDPYPFSATHLLVPTGGYFVPRALTERLSTAMRAVPPAAGALEPRAGATFGRPLVWIGLRLGDKSWVDQETALPALIEGLLARHPRATVLLDGWSYPLAEDEVSQRWRDTIAELGALADRVVDAVGRPGRVRNLVGNTLRESVLWARQVDTWLAPTGSTQHKVGWFTDAPGIIYASPGLRGIEATIRPGSWEAEISTLPRYVFGTPADQGRRRGATDRRRNIENLHLDVDELLEGLLELLAERYGAGAGVVGAWWRAAVDRRRRNRRVSGGSRRGPDR